MGGDGALALGLLPLLLVGVLAALGERQAVHAAVPALPASYMEDAGESGKVFHGKEPGSVSSALDEYSDNELERYMNPVKRACVRRGGNCDHRPNDCCYNSSCRCNLWGANCRCQRMGLFQKWG